MKSYIFKKFNKFIFYPDLANKFLVPTVHNITPSKNFSVYLKYIFSNRRSYDYIALKALMMISSIYPRRSQMSSRIIILKFGEARVESVVYIKISLNELCSIFSYFYKSPASLSTWSHGHVRESKHFVFPGFVKYLKFPSWTRYVNIRLNHKNTQDQYYFFFYKTAYLD